MHGMPARRAQIFLILKSCIRNFFSCLLDQTEHPKKKFFLHRTEMDEERGADSTIATSNFKLYCGPPVTLFFCFFLGGVSREGESRQ